jgi:hypothetical protein
LWRWILEAYLLFLETIERGVLGVLQRRKDEVIRMSGKVSRLRTYAGRQPVRNIVMFNGKMTLIRARGSINGVTVAA